MKLELAVQYAVDHAGLPNEADFQRWAERAVTALESAAYRRAELTVRIVDAAESASLNHRYRGKPGATNVLAFPLDPPPIPDETLAETLFGDIVLCAPVVAAEAVTQHKTAEAHWAHLLIHGVLHLLGYDHQGPDQAGKMERLETQLLDNLGYPDPYLVRPKSQTTEAETLGGVARGPN